MCHNKDWGPSSSVVCGFRHRCPVRTPGGALVEAALATGSQNTGQDSKGGYPPSLHQKHTCPEHGRTALQM